MGDEKHWRKQKLKRANWWLNAIQAPGAWEYNNRFNNIKIGIIDSGFDTGHEDLKISFTDEVNKAINNKDDHGTHVAGIIGATENNGKGIAGIVWNKELVCYDWDYSKKQNNAQSVLAGLICIVESGAKVVNISFAWDTIKAFKTDEDYFIKSGIDENAYKTSYFVSYLLDENYDFLIVQSAGNGAKNGKGVDAKNALMFAGITSENCYVNSNDSAVTAEDILNRIIVVAGTEQTDSGYQIVEWSNGGSPVDIAAPGQNIYSCITGGFTGSYGYMSGTSMAAPMVTGVASLVWSVNENFTGPEVKEIVCNNYSEWVPSNPNSPNAKSDKINIKDGKEIYGYPMVNAKLAVEEAIRRTDNDTLIGVVEEETEETTQNYEWYLEPTIQADNIIVPDYESELFEKYAIIERNNKYGIISKEGKVEVECSNVGYDVCVLGNTTYYMDNKINNNGLNEYTGYILENNKLIRTNNYHGHDGDYIPYYYDKSISSTLLMDLGIIEIYNGNEIFPVQEVSNKNANGYYETFGKYGLTKSKEVIKDFIYTNGIYTNNLIALEKDGLWECYDRKGNEIIPLKAKSSDYKTQRDCFNSINNTNFYVLWTLME